MTRHGLVDADALAIAAIAAFGGDASAVVARVGGDLGERAGARVTAISALAAIDAGAARRERALAAAIARAPMPAGMRGVHASWIEHALDDDDAPLATRAAIATGGGANPASVWLARAAIAAAAVPALPAASATWPTSVAAAVACDGATLADWLAAIGADQLALALSAAGGDALAHAAVALGGAAGARLRAAAMRIGVAPRIGALGGARAAIARSSGVRLADGDAALVRIAARAIAPHVREAIAHRQLAVRLPPRARADPRGRARRARRRSGRSCPDVGSARRAPRRCDIVNA